MPRRCAACGGRCLAEDPPADRGWKAWAALCALLLLGALGAWPWPSALLDWQPERATTEPWRLWSAAFVHWSEGHLAANALGALVLMALGWAARLPLGATAAWLLAWPLTHAGLWLRPELAHYGGLSGVLHAGVAVAATWLVLAAQGGRRAVGGLLLAGLLAKLVSERPWGEVLQHSAGWDIALTPWAHASGTVAGITCTIACALALRARPQNRRR